MKRYIWISYVTIFIFILSSCSSRKVSSAKTEEKIELKTEEETYGTSSLKINRTDIETSTKSINKINLSIKNNLIPSSDNTNKKCLEQRFVKYRDKDGNEADIPVNESSEINLNSESEVENKLKSAELEIDSKVEQIKKMNSEILILKKEKQKLSERVGVTFFQLLMIIMATALISIMAWELIKKYVSQYKLPKIQ
ncbi:hypothetical protein ACMGDK_11335 [Chryseobacterium sp. DT-3]|uniref:hypothetical protein n=1 Tax=Chryseobacterium sp. DT-3 TaxID=3396164 RepID=UPI003F1DB795